MSVSVEQYYLGSWVDISDYVTGMSEIPFLSRNRDWTIRADSLNITVAGSLIVDRTGWTNFQRGDYFRVYNNANLIFYGFVNSSEFNYESHTFDVEIFDNIVALQNKRIEYNVLHSELSSGSPASYEYTASDYYGYPDVGFLYLMQKMFDICNLTLDVSDIQNEIAFSDNINFKDYAYKEIFLDENMLYCINQSVATYYTTIDDTINEYNENKITFFELVNELCTSFKLMIQLVDVGSYKLAFSTVNYTISDDDSWQYTENLIKAEKTLDDIGVGISSALRADYQSTDITQLTPSSWGGGEKISYYSNLVLLVADPDILHAYATGSLQPAILEGHPENSFNPIKERVISRVTDRTEYKIKCPIQDDFKTIVQNFIDVNDLTSNIIQEEYPS